MGMCNCITDLCNEMYYTINEILSPLPFVSPIVVYKTESNTSSNFPKNSINKKVSNNTQTFSDPNYKDYIIINIPQESHYSL